MGRGAIVAGTGFEGRDYYIRTYCQNGMGISLLREPNNPYDENAIAVYLEVGNKANNVKIGYLKRACAKSLAKKMDEGLKIEAYVRSFDTFYNHPRVSLSCFIDV